MTDMATVDGARAEVTTAAIEELRSRTRGVVLEPADQHEHDLRPVFNPMDWVAAVEAVLLAPKQPDVHRAAVEHLDWRNLWPSTWRKWFEEGVRVLP